MKASDLSSFRQFLYFIHVFQLVTRFNIEKNMACLMENFHGLSQYWTDCQWEYKNGP